MDCLDMRELCCAGPLARRQVHPWRGQELWARWADSTSDFLRARNTLSSMHAPIIPLAFVFGAFGCKEPDDKF